MESLEKAEIVNSVLAELLLGNREKCKEIVDEYYPFSSYQAELRKYTPFQMTKVFVRDGFIDRYTGAKLIFPGIFRILRNELPDLFPSHSNWKMAETHIVYWELFPTIDHIYPVARGGSDSEENWITTSMLRNSAKANWTVEEIGWSIKEPGSMDDWDGLIGLFRKLLDTKPELRQDNYVRKWESALIKCGSNF